MTRRKDSPSAILALLAVLAAAPAAGQGSAAEVERDARAVETRAARQATQAEARAETVDVQLRKAEERLAEAAAEVAELSRRRLPDMEMIGRRLQAMGRPVLGVTIGGAAEEEGPVEGVTVRGVTPGSAAEDAGLRAGDVLTAINDESLSAATEARANDKLLDFMHGVEEGDTLQVEYLRDGRANTVEVRPQPAAGFAFAFGDRNWHIPVAPPAPGVNWYAFHAAGSWGDMEMVSLTEELGRYFGTDKGLLVVRAPEDESLRLQDGDVIQRIDGREPTSVAHAMRILGSYQSGETLEIEIMRDKKPEKLSIEVPDNRQGFLRGFPAAPAVAPAAAPRVRILRGVRPLGDRI